MSKKMTQSEIGNLKRAIRIFLDCPEIIETASKTTRTACYYKAIADALGEDGRCSVCGVTADIYPDPPEPAYCYVHCPDHDYQVIDRERRCSICNAPVPEDWYDYDEE